MNDAIDVIYQQFTAQSIGEIIAIIFAIAYVWLAAEESIWCWPAGFISTGIYAWVFFDVTLIFQMLLNIYYMLMAILGIFTWSKRGQEKLKISRMKPRSHFLFIGAGITLSYSCFWVATFWLNYDLLLLDIGITIFALLTTFLTVRKILESWVYWSFINLMSIFLYLESGLYLSILLMVIYIILAVRGMYQWVNIYLDRENYAA